MAGHVQVGSVRHHINNMKDKYHVIIPIDGENSTPISDKNSQKSEYRRNISQRNKSHV